MTRLVIESIRLVDAVSGPIAVIGIVGDELAHGARIPHRPRAAEVTDRDVVAAIARWLEGHEVSHSDERWRKAAERLQTEGSAACP